MTGSLTDQLALAGLWDGWKNAEGHWAKTGSILTTTPNAVTATVHDRMPVILRPDDAWRSPEVRIGDLPSAAAGRSCTYRTAPSMRRPPPFSTPSGTSPCRR
ncbi:MAG TPA: SOS response-associated peptidase family protein [Terriglobales bacterium]|nr:SOS response-associated peptidase family protein [Terriglobales bacterium]